MHINSPAGPEEPKHLSQKVHQTVIILSH